MSLRLEAPVDDLAAVRGEWTELAERSGNLFATWEWADVWWRHYGDGRTPAVVVCRDPEGTAAALLPLYVAFRPVRTARFIGHGPADQLGPICAPGDPRGPEALRRSAEEAGPDWQVLLADRLPGENGLPRALDGVALRHESNPVVEIEGVTWDEYLAGRSRNFRSQLRRRERKLLEEHGLRYRLSDDPERLPADMETLFRLHEARWGEKSSGALAGVRTAFNRDFAAVALERGWLRLWLAEVGGSAVAAWYGFRYGGAEWYYQLGRDPEWERESVGLVLLVHSLREAVNDGMREYRLLRGAEAYKSRFATRDDGVTTVALSRGAAGRFLVAAAGAAMRLPRPVRRVFTRRLT
jgi:CelD/BcsL family acetyltransferase involved in cellulose biosynthesis